MASHTDVLDMLAAGATPEQTAQELGFTTASMQALISHLCDQHRCKTVRALVYAHEARLQTRGRGLEGAVGLDPLTELVWAGLRLDVPDKALAAELAFVAGVERAAVHNVLDRLAAQYRQTSWHGLIRPAYRHGVLSGREGTTPAGIRVGRHGDRCLWDLSPLRLWILELTASGLTPQECARRTGVQVSAVYSHLRACAQEARVTSRPALVHEALRSEVIAPPEPAPAPDLSDTTAAVWRGMVLDVRCSDLPHVISRQTGLPLHVAVTELTQLRSTGRRDCRLVVEGWANGVLDERATVLAPAGHGPARLRAGAGMLPVTLTGQQRDLLTLIAVQGHSAEQAGVQMRIGNTAARRVLRTGLGAAQTASVRVLTHKACRDGHVPVQEAKTVAAERNMSGDMLAVWRGLVLDVPENRLAHSIAATADLHPHRVQECLDELRATGLSDPQLIVEGWARRVLDARTPLRPAVLAAPAGRAFSSWRAGGPVQPTADPLELIPAGHRQSTRSGPAKSPSVLAGLHTAGELCDFIRIPPGVCRALLARLDSARWGPVLGMPGSNAAVLVTAAGVAGPQRRGAAGRLWARGGRVLLPGRGRRTAVDGTYWAVPPSRPLWNLSLVDWLLHPHDPAGHEPADSPCAAQPAGRTA
ncbi:helix-turn-helix transcriptional regulator [Streptomyces sp. NPDC015350]|uniref:helix-turn-helix transcriptional regulator n=1 Tax=Streptomyces sp. NPDC015350 TaxID=3364955 RepID=UPI00370369FD